MLIYVSVALLLWTSFASAQTDDDSVDPERREQTPSQIQAIGEYPEILHCVHANGLFWNTINNNGILGNFFSSSYLASNKRAPNFSHPKGARVIHGNYSGLWIGGIVNGDTLVSTSVSHDTYNYYTRYPMEFWPDYSTGEEYLFRSNDTASPDYDPAAKAPWEYEAVFVDTIKNPFQEQYNPYDQRCHQPMGLKVTQTTYSWPEGFAEDFIIIDYAIENIGRNTIHRAFVGLYHLGAVYHLGEYPSRPSDDIAGYLKEYSYDWESLDKEEVNITWICDADGHAIWLPWGMARSNNALGIAALRTPVGAYLNNFNWWTESGLGQGSWGPRPRATPQYPVRYFYGQLGYPYGDKHKYYLMAKPEIDYSGYYSAIRHPGWLPPHDEGVSIASGHLPRVLTTWGPSTIAPGQVRHLTLVIMIGEEMIPFEDSYSRLWNPYYPKWFATKVSYEDLITNYRWAKSLYDNPGIDTDGDGDSGKAALVFDQYTNDSVRIFYEGDEIPDFLPPKPPAGPEFRVTTKLGKIFVRWNGQETERRIDPFTHIRDFEGYRIYISRSADDLASYSLLTSWDREDYSRKKWNTRKEKWELTEEPFTIDSLRQLYGSDFNPTRYSCDDPYRYNGYWYYFPSVDANQSAIDDSSLIYKVYPDAIPDTSDIDAEGRMRYYEYEYVIENLLPTPPYWVAVTSFDYGFPSKGLLPMESIPTDNRLMVFATTPKDSILQGGKLNVYIYPNPYRVDGGYSQMGFENRGRMNWAERERAIYFANLPNPCTISIYSLDGDLIRTIEHNEPASSGNLSTSKWDLISRNMQATVSGLYYWVVESEYGNQIGKLMIIR